MGALAPLNMFNTMLRAPLPQYQYLGALSLKERQWRPFQLNIMMHGVGAPKYVQYNVKGAPASVSILGRPIFERATMAPIPIKHMIRGWAPWRP